MAPVVYPRSFNDCLVHYSHLAEDLCFYEAGVIGEYECFYCTSWALNLGYGTTMYGFYGCIFVVTWAREFYDFCMHPDRRDEEASSQYNDSGGGGSPLGKRMYMCFLITLIAVVCTFCQEENYFYLYCPPLMYIGAALNIAVTLMFIGTHLNLGSNWSSVPEALAEHKLITTGLYNYARHPMYTSMLVYGTLAAWLATLNWLLTLVHVVSCGMIILPRLRVEEGILVDTFGDEYREYRKRVPALGVGTMWMNEWYEPLTKGAAKKQGPEAGEVPSPLQPQQEEA